jgi:hypothetical protein
LEVPNSYVTAGSLLTRRFRLSSDGLCLAAPRGLERDRRLGLGGDVPPAKDDPLQVRVALPTAGRPRGSGRSRRPRSGLEEVVPSSGLRCRRGAGSG